MVFTYAILPPNCGSNESIVTYVNEKLNEISFVRQHTADEIIVSFYTLIPEPDRITGKIRENSDRICTIDFIDLLRQNDILDVLSHVHIRLYHPIKTYETADSFSNWFEYNGDIANSYVIVGNHANKEFRTDNALLVLRDRHPNIIYGTVCIFHRTNELDRCVARIRLGVSFFVSQIMVDPIDNMTQYKSLSVPIHISLTIITHKYMFRLLKTLGVQFKGNDIEKYLGWDYTRWLYSYYDEHPIIFESFSHKHSIILEQIDDMITALQSKTS